MRILGMVTGHPVSAAEVAGVTGLAHAAASYHLRRLAAAGLVRAVPLGDGERHRGRPQQRYQMRDRDNAKGDRCRGLARSEAVARAAPTAGPG
ncbi:MAG: winged helix-turn-helix transcriptional regulator [Chloroflexi bacterium]|nr:MAG: winged helix-turn-helix transcriptional regulator [Chloroflexota bacterium]